MSFNPFGPLLLPSHMDKFRKQLTELELEDAKAELHSPTSNCTWVKASRPKRQSSNITGEDRPTPKTAFKAMKHPKGHEVEAIKLLKLSVSLECGDVVVKRNCG